LVWFYNSPEGEDIVGFSDAARSYFNKPFAHLSEDQYLSLVAMLIGPTNYNPRTQPKENAERVESLRHIVIGRCRQ
jgi:membrane peptidoglycan carboxypeptidase